MNLMEKLRLTRKVAKDFYWVILFNKDILDYLGITNKVLYNEHFRRHQMALNMLSGDVYLTVENIILFLNKRTNGGK